MNTGFENVVLAGNIGRIPTLDGLRCIAILMVVASHGAYSIPFAFPKTIEGVGALGVRIFFVLSGFLIYTLSYREVLRHGVFDGKKFYLRRVLRIFPAFYLYLGLLFVLVLFGLVQLSYWTLLSAGTFTQNLYSVLWQPFLGGVAVGNIWLVAHYWTLAVEEQFYLAWPTLMWLRAKKLLIPTLLFVVFSAPLVRVFLYLYFPDLRGSILFLTSYDGIAVGVLLGWLLNETSALSTQSKWLPGVFSSVGFRRVCLCFSWCYLLVVSPLLNERFGGYYRLPVGISSEIFITALVIAIGVTSGAESVYRRLLDSRLLTYIGTLSFSIYVYNMMFLDAESKEWYTQPPVNFILLGLFAVVSYHLIEMPFLRLRARFRS